MQQCSYKNTAKHGQSVKAIVKKKKVHSGPRVNYTIRTQMYYGNVFKPLGTGSRLLSRQVLCASTVPCCVLNECDLFRGGGRCYLPYQAPFCFQLYLILPLGVSQVLS